MAKKSPTPAPHIVQDGDPVLRRHADKVRKDEFGTPALAKILRDMQAALDGEDDGVAIAAPQIGVSKRIFIVSHRAFQIEDEMDERERGPRGKRDISQKEVRTADMICINPELVKLSKKKVKVPEGCLSVRWKYGNTLRAEKATLRAQDEHGNVFTYGGSGLLAQIFQHETDHLNGTLFIDHAKDIEDIPPEKVKEIREGKQKQGR